MGKVIYSFKDYSNEPSTVTFYNDPVNAGNLAAQTALMDALTTAIEGLTLGKIVREQMVAINTDNGDTPASDVNSQRERKWLVHMADSVTSQKVTVTIPCADLSGGRLVANTDIADLTHADWLAFIDAVEGNFNNPATGNSLLVLSAEKVGRNL